MAGTIVADKWQNGDGTENYKCKAWVNFNGTGTVAIRASGNVSSITDGGIGTYTVNFTTAMPDNNYIVVGNCNNWTGSTTATSVRPTSGGLPSVSSVFVLTTSQSAIFDPEYVAISIFR